jgi:hypothetical protein
MEKAPSCKQNGESYGKNGHQHFSTKHKLDHGLYEAQSIHTIEPCKSSYYIILSNSMEPSHS